MDDDGARTTPVLATMNSSGSAFRLASSRHPAARWWLGAVLTLAATIVAAPPLAAAEAPDDGATIAGVVVDADGRPQLGVIVQLYTTGVDGGADRPIRPAHTDADGRYRLEDLPADCYLVVVQAPAGATFAGGAATDEHEVCIDPGQTDESLRSTTEPPIGPVVEPPEGPVAEPPERPVVEPPGGPAAVTVDILHVGRHAGRLEPSAVRLDLTGLTGLTVEAEAGGWPRLEAAIRADGEPAAIESTITVHTGGILGGTALSQVFGGAADAAMLNRTCFDVVAPSPDDLRRDPSLETFVDFLADGGCDTGILLPTDGAATDPATQVPGAAIRMVGSELVAFVSTADRLGPRSDPVAATRSRVERLVAAGFDNIVLISDLGRQADRQLVAGLPGVDAVIGAGRDEAAGPATEIAAEDRLAVNLDREPVCLSYSAGGTASLGHLQIGFDGRGGVTDCRAGRTFLLGRQLAIVDPAAGRSRSPTPAERRRVEAAIAEDATVDIVDPSPSASRALDSWGRALDVLLDQPVGTVEARRCRTAVPGRQVGLLCGTDDEVADLLGPRADAQQLVAKAFRAAAEANGPTPAEAGGRPTVVVIRSGTVDRGFEPGSLRRGEVYRIVPGDRTLTELVLTGAELAAALEEGIAAAIDGGVDRPADPDAFPHTDGLVWRPDYGRTSGRRLGVIELTGHDGTTGPVVDPEADYRVITTDDLVAGDRAYPTFEAAAADGRATATSTGDAEAIVAYIVDVLGGTVSRGDDP